MKCSCLLGFICFLKILFSHTSQTEIVYFSQHVLKTCHDHSHLEKISWFVDEVKLHAVVVSVKVERVSVDQARVSSSLHHLYGSLMLLHLPTTGSFPFGIQL